MTNIKYLIPARKGSKGLPYKNRMLFNFTSSIVKNHFKNVFVSSNDNFIKNLSYENNFNFHERSEKNSSDTSTTKEFVEEFINFYKFKDDDIIVMLMLTYPERKKEDIENAIKFFIKNNGKSLLCKKECFQTPYLMMFEEDNFKGKQVIKHNLCRRQDYRKVFEISHFISIFKVSEVKKLNNNLYNENTLFYNISNNTLDIDNKKDLENFYENKNNC